MCYSTKAVSLSVTVLMVGVFAGASDARANDYTRCLEAGQQTLAQLDQLRHFMQVSNRCAGEPDDFEAPDFRRQQVRYYRTRAGQACRAARRICGDWTPEVGLHHCGRFIKGGAGYPNQISQARQIYNALDTAYENCPAQ